MEYEFKEQCVTCKNQATCPIYLELEPEFMIVACENYEREDGNQTMARLQPVSADSKGYTDMFKCSYCRSIMLYNKRVKELHYEHCPYCGKRIDGIL